MKDSEGKRSKSPIKSSRKQSHRKRLMLMVKTVGVCRDKYSESMDRLYKDEFDERRERR
jgi:hypothetical protein